MIEYGLYPNRSGLIREATRDFVSKAFSQAASERLDGVARAAAAIIKDSEPPGVVQVILYGSVARHEATDDSDIDLLVLIDDKAPKDDALTAAIDVTAPIEVATGTVITPIVMKRSQFEQMLADGYGFAVNVSKDGIVLYDGAVRS